MPWTLEYNSTTKTLAQWGFSADFSLDRFNQAPDVLRASIPGSAAVAPVFDYAEEVIVRNPAGAVWFRGKVRSQSLTGTGAEERVQYEFAGPWWDLERLVFQQSWETFTGYTTPGDSSTPPTFDTVYSSELFLGQKANGDKQHSGEQIEEIIDHAATNCGLAIQAGTIDPEADIPIYNTRDITCAEGIIQMLRWTPDTVTWFDYTTTPPTLHARQLANLATATVTLSTDKLRQLALVPRYDLQLGAVVIRYKKLNDDDGVIWLVQETDAYPPGATGLELDASVHTIELGGARTTRVTAEITTATVDAQHGTESNRIAWWKKKDKLLNDPGIDGSTLHITSATVKDEGGSTVSLSSFPEELLNGQIADWMEFGQEYVTVEATATFDRFTDDTFVVPVEEGATRTLTVRIVVTDGTTGTYGAVNTFEEAEATPVDLAETIYNATQDLRWDGTLALVGDEVPSGLHPGKKVTVVGGLAGWTNMMVQQTTEEPHLGRVTVRLGAPAQLGVSDLVELLRVNRYRLIYNRPSQRQSAVPGDSQVDLGADLPRENTSSGMPTQETFSSIKDSGGGDSAIIKHDAPNAQFLVQVVDNTTGTRIDDEGYVRIKLSECEGSDSAKHGLYIQEVDCCIEDPENPGSYLSGYKRMVLTSDPYLPS